MQKCLPFGDNRKCKNKKIITNASNTKENTSSSNINLNKTTLTHNPLIYNDFKNYRGPKHWFMMKDLATETETIMKCL